MKLFERSGKDQVYIDFKAEKYPYHNECKIYLEKKYGEIIPYLDTGFSKKLSYEFYSRCWELTLAHYFKSQAFLGINLLEVKKNKNKSAPDFRFSYEGRNFYVEAICPSPGDRRHLKVSLEEISGKARKIPLTEYKEVLSSAIKEKAITRYEGGYQKFMDPSDGLIIAISLAKIPFWSQPGRLDIDLSCLFPISDIKVPIILSSNGQSGLGRPYRDYQDHFFKTNGQLINANYFMNEKFSYISALLISYTDLMFFSEIIGKYLIWDPPKCGNDFVLIHNPYAKVSLPFNLLPVAQEVTASIENNNVSIETKKY